jgi:putative transposase
MPRYLRAFLVGYPHHIVQRGHDRKPVFACERDCLAYLGNLREQIDERDIRLFAYCLMTNHVHLLVEPSVEGGDLSRLMRVLAGRQTRYVNRLEGRTGTLWEGRFKCSIVDAESYLIACCRYIERNPVRARMVQSAADYRWSSFRQRCGLVEPVMPLAPLPVVGAYGPSFSEYTDYVTDEDDVDDIGIIRSAINRNQLTGNDRFRSAMEEKLGRRMSDRAPGRPKKVETTQKK